MDKTPENIRAYLTRVLIEFGPGWVSFRQTGTNPWYMKQYEETDWLVESFPAFVEIDLKHPTGRFRLRPEALAFVRGDENE